MVHTVDTACPLDCPDTCGLRVTVDEGRIVAIDASDANAITDGFICHKVRKHARRVYAPERILTPLLRVGRKGEGEFVAISWDDALDRIESAFREAIDRFGAESIVPYLYSSSAGSLQSVLIERFFHRLGATEVDHTICAATHGYAWHSVYPDMASTDPRDIVHAKLIVIWGANPAASNTHLLPLINQAQRDNGARIVVVDPRRTAAARRADQWIPVRPGTDVVLALAIARELAERDLIDRAFVEANVDGLDDFLEAAQPWTLDKAEAECGVAATDIAQLAHDLATIRPATVRPGWGLERTRNGGSACAAVMALPALVGQFGVPGSGVLVSTSGGDSIQTGKRAPEERHDPRPRHLNMNALAQWLTDGAPDPPVAVLFVQGANPVVMNPNAGAVARGLEREDLFTIVHEQVMTDTARYADLVLPAATHFEYDDVAGSYGSYALQPVQQVIATVGEAWSNHRLGAALAQRFGFPAERFPASERALRDECVAAWPQDGASAELSAPGSVVQFATTRPAGGRAQLARVIGVGVPRYEPLDSTYPLTLITPASPKLINSMFGEFNAPDASIRMHPDDAAARGLSDGTMVRVHNDLGSVRTTLTIDDSLRPGVASMTKGVWWRAMPDGVGVNVLMPDTFSDVADGACFNDARVEVSRADG